MDSLNDPYAVDYLQLFQRMTKALIPLITNLVSNLRE